MINFVKKLFRNLPHNTSFRINESSIRPHLGWADIVCDKANWSKTMKWELGLESWYNR